MAVHLPRARPPFTPVYAPLRLPPYASSTPGPYKAPRRFRFPRPVNGSHCLTSYWHRDHSSLEAMESDVFIVRRTLELSSALL
jgi:hypothetical protein